jgi:lipopolysaccharide export system protein LptA
MAVGLAIFLAGFRVYAHFLGGIDGLTPLPEDYWPDQDSVVVWPPPPPLRSSELENKLRMAFGDPSAELKRIIRLEIPSRHLVLAADDFQIVREGERKGQVRLAPLSIAVFGKGSYPEINTVTCNEAYLTFDKEIATPDQLGKSKIISAELVGGGDPDNERFVVITNNRRTPERNDDVYLRTKGPVFYVESLHRIWTDADVLVEDMQSQPKPTTITAVGMDLFLTPEAEPGKPAPTHKSKQENITGVDRINLRSNVRMHLFVDPQSSFLGPEKPGPAATKPAAPPAANKDEVVISTDGPFSYNVAKDQARFEISHRRSTFPGRVQVIREHQNSQLKDELKSDQLDLQFKRKNPNDQLTKAAAADDRSVELEIESAHASQLHEPVEVASEYQGLNTSSHDLYYDAPSRKTLLKGDPVHVMKDGNEIVAQEVLLTGIDKKESQQATAKGPGVIHLLDRDTGRRTLHARWMNKLTYSKDGPYDCLTLTGDAAFEDDEHGQKIQAQNIKVWLEPAGADKAQEQRPRPHHLEASGQVRIDSPDLQVVDPTDTLVIWFEDGPAIGEPGNRAVFQPLPEAGAGVQTPPSPSEKRAGQGGQPSDKPKNRLRLSAHVVKAHVSRSGNKSDLKNLECAGTVRVLQDPAGPDDKGVDIRGDSLQLTHQAEGNLLVVTGNSQNLAQVQLNKITIHGHEVQIDQVINTAKVDGAGHMLLLTATDFEGNKLAKPTELVIHWDKAMRFDGKHAEFSGGIQAEQNASRLLCQEMQVYLDRSVSFKQGEPNGQPAKVEYLVCDQRQTKKPVFVEDHKWQRGQLIGYQRIVAPAISADNKNGTLSASGPGIVSLLQMGAAANLPNGGVPPAKAVKQQKQELLLTRISYAGLMNGENVRRIAKFYDQVQVIHGPADDPDLNVNPANPPPGFMVLSCDKVEVYSHPLPNGQKSQEMRASGKVRVHAQEFWGNAQEITYDETKEEVVFHGTKENPAVLYRVKTKGANAEKVAGETIYYFRQTRSYRVVNGDRIIVSP